MSKEKPIETTYYQIYGTLKDMPLNMLSHEALTDKNILKTSNDMLKGSKFKATRYEKRTHAFDFTPAKQEIESHFLYQQHSLIDLRRVGDKIALYVSPMARDENDKTFALCFADLEIAEEMFSKMIIVIDKMRKEKEKFNRMMKEVIKNEKD